MGCVAMATQCKCKMLASTGLYALCLVYMAVALLLLNPACQSYEIAQDTDPSHLRLPSLRFQCLHCKIRSLLRVEVHKSIACIRISTKHNINTGTLLQHFILTVTRRYYTTLWDIRVQKMPWSRPESMKQTCHAKFSHSEQLLKFLTVILALFSSLTKR